MTGKQATPNKKWASERRPTAKDTALEQRITTLETQNSKNIDRNYDAIQQTIKAQQTILDRLGRK